MSRRITMTGLETICWISRLGSFTAAGERLHTTQPAISARVRELEAVLGVRIFQRRGKTIEPTIEGRAILAYAEPLYRQLEEFNVMIGRLDATTGTLRIGTGQNICLTWLPEMLRLLSDEMPRLTFTLEVGMAAKVLEDLDGGKVDIGILPGPVDGFKYESVSVGFEKFIWACPPSVAQRLQDVEGARDLPEDIPLWIIARGSYFHRIAFGALGIGRGVERQINEISNIAGAVALVARGNGIGFLSETMTLRELENGEIVAIDHLLKPHYVEYFAVCRKQDKPQMLITTSMQAAAKTSTFARTVPDGSDGKS